MACNSKTAGRRAKKGSEIWQTVIELLRMWGWLTFYCSTSFRVIRCTCLKLACNLKTASHERNNEIWDSRVHMGSRSTCIFNVYVVTFDLLVLNAILGSFGALVSKWPVTRKRLVVECNIEIWDGVGWGREVGGADSCSILMEYLWPL